jgi:hypothetical protein
MTTIARAWEAFLQAIEGAKALHAAGANAVTVTGQRRTAPADDPREARERGELSPAPR